jgi:alkylhydroperoxidase/carboxymuconolactone decarboxylase family protein YurZ
VGPAAEAGVTLEEVQSVLVAVAPIVGTARTMAAAINITEALGFAIAVIDDATTED